MSLCPSCGAEMKFNTRTQSMLCPYCVRGSDIDILTGFGIYDKEPAETELIRYSCPQCGGSIYSTEQSINGFCSYCGSHVTLESRVAKMKYPKYVAPFRIQKAACKQLYLDYVKKAIFAPKEMRNPEYIDQFRGIYMPYWGYDVTMDGFIYLDGDRRSAIDGHTEYYKCMGWLHAVYNNIFFDASSTFEDHYSMQIAPFDYTAVVDFSPAYLSGFYADMPDLPDDVYEEEALLIGKKKVFKSERLRKYFPRMHFDKEQEERFLPTFDAFCSATYTTFFPVWFLSYQYHGRVAHAVVNGQTGRLVSDLPVDKKKFLLAALLISLPLLAALTFCPAISPIGYLILSEVFSLFSVLQLMYLIRNVYIRRYQVYDKGYLSKTGQLNYLYRLKQNGDRRKEILKKKGIVPLIAAALIVGIPLLFRLLLRLTGNLAMNVAMNLNIVLLFVILQSILWIHQLSPKGKTPLIASLLLILASSGYATFLTLIYRITVRQIHASVFLLMIGTLLAQIMALDQYNIIVTRPLSQMNRKGGNTDERDF
ncbi:MAG: hypothetical protein IJ600_10315 [Lachnospiraceae bacterium]|nr:hypothetical protein [Lachnospiraceae bacterium]